MLNIANEEKLKTLAPKDFHTETTSMIRSITRRWDYCIARIPNDQPLLDAYYPIINAVLENSRTPELEHILIGIPVSTSEENTELSDLANRFLETEKASEDANEDIDSYIEDGNVHVFQYHMTDNFLAVIYHLAYEIGTHGQLDCDIEHSQFTLMLPSPLPSGFSDVKTELILNGFRIVVVDPYMEIKDIHHYAVSFLKEDLYTYNSEIEFHPYYTREIPELRAEKIRTLRDFEVQDSPNENRKSLRYCNIFYTDTKSYDKEHNSYYPSKELAETLLCQIQEWEIGEYPDLESLQTCVLYYIGIPDGDEVETLDNSGFSNEVNFTTCEANTMKCFEKALKRLGIVGHNTEFKKDFEANYIFVETYLTKSQIEKVLVRNLPTMVNRVEVIVIHRSPLKKGDN